MGLLTDNSPQPYGLLAEPGNRSGSGLLGYLSDADLLSLAGFMKPTRGGNFGDAFANGMAGAVEGRESQLKRIQQAQENNPEFIKNKYRWQAEGKALAADEFPEAERWGMAPAVSDDGKWYQFGSNGSVREVIGPQGRFANPTTVDTGGNLRVINPNRPETPLATYPKELTPSQSLENRPDRYRQTPNADGSFTQTDTNTGKQDIVNNPNGPKAPPSEYLNTMAALDDFIPKLDDYIEALKGRGRIASVLPGQEKLNLGQKHGDLTMNLKSIFQLGVLNKGDLPQIERQIMNPVEPGATLYSNDALIEQARKAKEAMLQKREALKNQFRGSGYRVDSPVRGLVPFNGQDATVDYTDVDAAKKDLQNHPEWPQETRNVMRSLIDKNSPYRVNKSSTPTLKKPSANELSSAKAKIAEFANDPTAQENVRNQIIKRMQDAGYDTTGL